MIASMSAFVLTIIGFLVYGAAAVPVVIKESSPNGESIIAISASDPELEKYLLNSLTSQRVNTESDLLRSNFYNPEVESYGNFDAHGFGAPGKSVAGSSRSLEGHIHPFLVPFFLPPNLDAFQLNNWFRNIESVYEHPNPNFDDGEVRTVSAVNDNGHVYGTVETHFGNRAP